MEILPQPDGSTCGPTCLHAVYRHYGDDLPLERVIAEVAPLPTGGTLAVQLASHALRRGYRSIIYTYNLQLFDPTWFERTPSRLAERLATQRKHKADAKLQVATDAYHHYLELGGRVVYRELDAALLGHLLSGGTPVLTGLSATYLYGCSRERGDAYDDTAGEPTGHFVVLRDYDYSSRTVAVADPLLDNPRYRTQHYRVSVERVIAAILLGVVTYDANLLVIRPK